MSRRQVLTVMASLAGVKSTSCGGSNWKQRLLSVNSDDQAIADVVGAMARDAIEVGQKISSRRKLVCMMNVARRVIVPATFALGE
jgi:excinuclease UvrABC ATPase subunit